MILAAIPLTLGVYWVALKLNRRFRLAVLNPVLVAMAVLIGFFLVFRSQLPAYQRGAQPLTWLLSPAVVALALPLYKQLPHVRRRLKAIALSTLAGSVCSIVVGTALALLAGGSHAMAASLAPKAVTTPVAMAIASSTGGIPSVTAAAVIFAGILGASFGFAFLERIGVAHDESLGLAMGAASHALGTAKAAETDETRGAFSSLALVICAVLTSVVAPIAVPLMLRSFGA